MTPEQERALLSLYGGTFKTDIHSESIEKDLRYLYDNGLLDDEYNINTRGILVATRIISQIGDYK